jgi:hypothetical protein
MTAAAVRAELSFVGVLMTRDALCLEPEKRIRFVALIALKSAVLSFEGMSREGVIE